MREIKFRAKYEINNEWKYGYLNDVGVSAVIYCSDERTYYHCDKDTVGQFTGLRDKNGKEIWEGDRLRFFGGKNCVWEGTVTFEDGVFSVSILDAKQVKNPDEWDKKHNWVESRWWGTLVGYGEWGTWNCPRQSLAEIGMFDNYEQLKPLYKKYGYKDRIINVEIIGNIWDNPELLEE